MSWRLGNSIRLRLQTGLQLWGTWGNIKENVKPSPKESLGMHEMNQHKPWFYEECLHFLDQRKQGKMQ